MPMVIKESHNVLSVPQAAAVLGISQSKMYEVVRIKGFPCIRIGKRILVHREKFDAWIAEMAEKGWYLE